MKNLSTSTFDWFIQSWLCLIDFATDRCEPCKSLEKTLSKIELLCKDVLIWKVDSWNESLLIEKYSIFCFPTVLIFKDWKEVERIVWEKKSDHYLESITYRNNYVAKQDVDDNPLYDISNL